VIALPHHHAAIVAALVARGVSRDVAIDCAGNYLSACMDAAMAACDARGIDAWETVWRAADGALNGHRIERERQARDLEAHGDYAGAERVRLLGDGFEVHAPTPASDRTAEPSDGREASAVAGPVAVAGRLGGVNAER